MARQLLDGDATAFGEDLDRLREGMLGGLLGERMRTDYQRALDHRDSAKDSLMAATTVAGATAVEQMLNDGRFYLACVVAGRDGVEPPQRRDPCFFDPRHGPAAADVTWAPPVGVARTIAVCRRDQHRLAVGEEPGVRLIRVGDRWVPRHEAGGSVAYVAQQHAHVRSGASTSLTDAHVAEAHTRAALNGGINSMGGPLG